MSWGSISFKNTRLRDTQAYVHRYVNAVGKYPQCTEDTIYIVYYIDTRATEGRQCSKKNKQNTTIFAYLK